MVTRLEAVYCDGWDAEVVNPLPMTVARERDAAGEPYTVVLLVQDQLHAVMDLSWRDEYCGVSRFDTAGRQLSRHVFRGAGEGDLFLREIRTWDGPPDAGRYEYPHVAARTLTTFDVAGLRTDIIEPRGDLGARQESTSTQSPPRLSVPEFGRWHRLLSISGDASVEFVDVVRHQLPVSAGGRLRWRPPRPLAPHGVEDLFVPDAVVEVEDRRLRLSVHTAGPLHLRSGRLVAADPASLDFDAVPFTVLVPPGSYPVSVSLATFVDDPRHSRVCAVRLDVTRQPVVRWEMALRDGQEPRELGYREFFGFGADSGMACFVDAASADGLRDVWRTLDGLVEPRHRTIDSGAMVAWSSGWGDGTYPTWVGHDAAGGVACFVADMLLFPTGDDEEDDA